MSDYEATAYLSLEKLKEKHNLEIQQLHEKIKSEHSAKMQLSRSLMELKDKVKKLTFQKRYEEAELLQMQC
jgi:TPP-dependent 2-oxoacid decarboxylase